jgi:hypothetical protein
MAEAQRVEVAAEAVELVVVVVELVGQGVKDLG